MSEYLLFLLILSIFGGKGAIFWRDRVLSRRRVRAWQDLASECGLQVVQAFARSPQVTAQAGPVAATIETAGGNGSARVVVWVPGPSAFYNVRIRREPLVRRTGEIEIGDSSFDSRFFLEGPTQQVLALLDAETRRLLTSAMAESRLEISGGLFRAEQTDDERVPYVLPLLLDVGRRAAGPTSIPRRLAHNAKCDPEPGVRLQNLLCLIRELPEAPETLEVLRTARSDPSPGVRLQAAKGLGAEGRDLLLDLAESLVDDAVSAEAVSALDRELSFERTKAILDQALDRSRPRTARACLEALGKSGDAAAAEPPLLLALQREESDLRMAAANALARVGSVAAVLPLQEAAGRSPRDKELHRATREAIAEIQSRLHGASPGQLSLGTTEAGQLSLTQAEIGQLSLAQTEAGQLSLAQTEAGPSSLAQTELAVVPHPAGELSLPPEELEPPARRAREAPGGRRV